MDDWREEWMNGSVGCWTDACTNPRMDGLMNGRTIRRNDGGRGERTDRRTDERMDRFSHSFISTISILDGKFGRIANKEMIIVTHKLLYFKNIYLVPYF